MINVGDDSYVANLRDVAALQDFNGVLQLKQVAATVVFRLDILDFGSCLPSREAPRECCCKSLCCRRLEETK